MMKLAGTVTNVGHVVARKVENVYSIFLYCLSVLWNQCRSVQATE